MELFGKTGMFVCGVLFGTAGLKILATEEARKVYVPLTAAVLRARDYTTAEATRVKVAAEDILAEAAKVNEDKARGADGNVIADTAE